MSISPVLLRACGRGNQSACNIVRRLRVMYAGSVLTFSNVSDDKTHDNKMPFEGTLLLTDAPSDKPPHGSEGHRIYVSTRSAMDALPGIIGQAVNYQSDLTAHASRHKVGVITKAWMEGNKVKVAGQIWVHDFPEAKVLKGRKDLGMSMELSSVLVEDDDADVWKLEKFNFTGATILLKNAAAYTKTSLAAVAAAAKVREGEIMPKHSKDEKRKVAAAHKDTGQNNLALMTQAISGSLGQAIQNAFTPLIAEIKASNDRVTEGFEELKALHLTEIHASAMNDEDEEDDSIVLHAGSKDASSSASEAEMDASASASASEEEMEAAREDDSEEDDSSASASASESDVNAMEELGLEDASEKPGEVNKDASSKGSKSSVTNPPKQTEHFKGNVAKGRIHSSRKVRASKDKDVRKPLTTSIQAAALIGDLQSTVRQIKRQMKAQAAEHEGTVSSLRKRLKKVNAQVEKFAALEGRRSVSSHELLALGEKVGVDFNETRNNGQKYTVKAFDSILAAAQQVGVNLTPRQRIQMKMLAEQNNILDEGAVNRIGQA